MTNSEWVARLPALMRAVIAAGAFPARGKAKVWQDNERFLMAPAEYTSQGLSIINFLTSSGDLNPIETVWARLRRDLAAREQADLQKGKVLTVARFRARVAQLLKSYSTRKPGEEYHYYQKLVRGMPGRLARCRKNKFGSCGK